MTRQEWVGQTNKRKSLKGKQISQRHTASHRNHTKHQTSSHNIIAEDLMQTHLVPIIIASISVAHMSPA